MAVFDLSFMNKNTRSATGDYSVLVDGLSIYESQLSADGKLSPGDYSLLISKAQSLYGNPGLTPANRAAIDAKIAGWKSQASQSTLKQSQDITRITNESKDDSHAASLFLGNNPKAFLTAQAASQQAKIAALSDAINQLDSSGQDSSSHVQEYNSAVQDYSDTLEALNAVETHQAGQPPSSDQVAYITTNGKGEITDVHIGREGADPGYLETNGLYGGLKIYGKLNRKDSGKNVFLLGNKTFSGTDVVIPGPDGTLKPSTLTDTAGQKGKAGIFTTAVAGYSEIDPTTVRTQSSIPTGAYGRGSNGFLYKRQDDGSYAKYVNADAKKLGIADNDIIQLPRSIEQGIIPQVKSTIDANVAQPTMPAATGFASTSQLGSGPTAPPPAPAAAGGHPAASAPTAHAPQGVLGIAKDAISSAGGFLGRLFGGGQ